MIQVINISIPGIGIFNIKSHNIGTFISTFNTFIINLT